MLRPVVGIVDEKNTIWENALRKAVHVLTVEGQIILRSYVVGEQEEET